MSENLELRLERETCSRCQGSGQHSRCESYGTTCFKCRGRKEVLSRRGEAAATYLRQLRSCRADQVKCGATIKVGALTFSGTPFDVWVKVEETGLGYQEGASLQDGVMVPYRLQQVILTGRSPQGELHTERCMPERQVELLLSREEQVETLRQALAYQATLTKAGVVRKSARKAGV